MSVPDDILYARDLDGTGSPHVCCKSDPGAYLYCRKDAGISSEAHKLLTAAYHALRSYQHHNSSEELAAGIADEIATFLDLPQGSAGQ